MYSFNDILRASFVELSDQLFVNTVTAEPLGLIWAKYGSKSKMEAMANNGIIEFMAHDKRTHITKVYGKDFDRDQKVFHATHVLRREKESRENKLVLAHDGHA